MFYYGLDVHKRFIQVCRIDSAGKARKDFRVEATREAILAFAKTLDPNDHVVLEATFHTWAIWTLLVPHCGRVVVANAMRVKAIAHARIKTDKVDAHILAQLLRTDFIPEVEMPGEKTWELRQLVSHRMLLARKRTAVRNAIHSILNRKLLHCPHSELFSLVGRRWMLQQQYTKIERFMLENNLSLFDELVRDIQAVEEKMIAIASRELDVKLLMTIPGVNVTVAIGMMATIGDVGRFATPDKLASYFGLVARVHQSADHCYHGRITKEGSSSARWLAVEAAQTLAQMSSPLAASYHRIKRKRGHNVAVVALARKLVVLAWHILSNQEPYRYAPVARTRQKLRRLTPGSPPAKRDQMPRTLDAVYAEANLPALSAASSGEKRAASINKRGVTVAKKQSRA
jgi:transposase